MKKTKKAGGGGGGGGGGAGSGRGEAEQRLPSFKKKKLQFHGPFWKRSGRNSPFTP